MTATIPGKTSELELPDLYQCRQDCSFTLLPASAHRLYTQGMHVGYILDLYPEISYGMVMSRGQSILDRFYDNVNVMPEYNRAQVFPQLLKHMGMKKLSDDPTYLEMSTEPYHREGFRYLEARLVQNLLRTVADFIRKDANWYTPLEGNKIATGWAYVCKTAGTPHLTRYQQFTMSQDVAGRL